MPAPTDRVRLLKTESPTNGGTDDDVGFPALCNPHEDAPEVQGIFFQPPSPSTTKDELVWVRRDAAGNLLFRDNVDQTERTISDLVAGGIGLGFAIFTTEGGIVHTTGGDAITKQAA